MNLLDFWGVNSDALVLNFDELENLVYSDPHFSERG